MTSGELLVAIDRFRERVPISETAFGLGAMNDGKFVQELRSGRRCWPETAQKVLKFISEYERQDRAA